MIDFDDAVRRYLHGDRNQDVIARVQEAIRRRHFEDNQQSETPIEMSAMNVAWWALSTHRTRRVRETARAILHEAFGRAYCSPENEKKTVDPVLGQQVAIEANTVELARAIFRDAFAADPDFRNSYVANVACALMDDAFGLYGGGNSERRNNLASKIVDLFCKD